MVTTLRLWTSLLMWQTVPATMWPVSPAGAPQQQLSRQPRTPSMAFSRYCTHRHYYGTGSSLCLLLQFYLWHSSLGAPINGILKVLYPQQPWRTPSMAFSRYRTCSSLGLLPAIANQTQHRLYSVRFIDVMRSRFMEHNSPRGDMHAM